MAFAEAMGVHNYRAALAGFLAGYDAYLPAVAPDGGEAAMGGDEPSSPTWTGTSVRRASRPNDEFAWSMCTAFGAHRPRELRFVTRRWLPHSIVQAVPLRTGEVGGE